MVERESGQGWGGRGGNAVPPQESLSMPGRAGSEQEPGCSAQAFAEILNCAFLLPVQRHGVLLPLLQQEEARQGCPFKTNCAERHELS